MQQAPHTSAPAKIALSALALAACVTAFSPAALAEGASSEGVSAQSAQSQPASSLGGTPAIRRGAFLDLAVGAETAIGGSSPETGAASPSSPSLYLQVRGGYSILPSLELGASFSLGAVGNRCLGAVSDRGECIESATDWRGVSGDFTVSSLMAYAAFVPGLTERLSLSFSAAAGWAFLDPEPRIGLSGAFVCGLSAGILWATPLEHFFLGADIGWQFVPQASLHALSLSPRIRYVF